MTDYIYKLRVIKSAVRTFPFDVFYVVSEAHKTLLPKLFPWSLCMTIEDPLRVLLNQLIIHREEERPHGGRLICDGMKHHTKFTELVPPDFPFLVVPILPLTRQGMHRKPAEGCEKVRYTPYLMAPRHALSSEKPTIEGVLDDDVVLFTPDGPVRPICHKCPQVLFHIQGLCALGNKTCFEELKLWAPESSATEEESDVELQTDHADAAGSPVDDSE